MANGNGKNGKNGNGNGNGANGVKGGNGTAGWQVAQPPTAPPAIVVPPRSLTPVVVGATVLAVGGGVVYAVHRWRQSQLPTPDPATSLQESDPGQTPQPSQTIPNAPATVPANYWGTTALGEAYRPLFTKLEAITGMPLRLYLCVVANREASWVRSARNKDKVEVDGSQRAIDGGLKRGNPVPKYAKSLSEAGSGGLFGALAPYVAWTGMDEEYMPYIDEDWQVIEDPLVAAACAAKYYQRIVGGGRYPVFADPAKPSPEDNYRVRLGWANPERLKNDTNGELFQAVKGRFDEDLAELGLKISDLPPPNANNWPGLKAVVAALKDFPVTWK